MMVCDSGHLTANDAGFRGEVQWKAAKVVSMQKGDQRESRLDSL